MQIKISKSIHATLQSFTFSSKIILASQNKIACGVKVSWWLSSFQITPPGVSVNRHKHWPAQSQEVALSLTITYEYVLINKILQGDSEYCHIPQIKGKKKAVAKMVCNKSATRQ